MNIVNVGYDSTNYYIIEHNERRLLIDVGMPGTLPKLTAAMRRKGIALRDVHYLFVTHYHPDHAGIVQDVKRLGVRHLLLDEQREAALAQKRYVKAGSGYLDITLHDSASLPAGESRAWLARLGFHGQIVLTPGHSDDSASLVLDDGIAFTGDLPLPMMVGESRATILEESWKQLRALNVSRIYSGHGPAGGFPFA